MNRIPCDVPGCLYVAQQNTPYGNFCNQHDFAGIRWISVKNKPPPKKGDPIVYARRKDSKTWHVGIAYWTVSKKYNPEMESTHAPEGFTHWIPLPEETPA